MTRWTDQLGPSPIPWLLERACAPIQYRTLTEIQRKKGDDWDVQRAKERVYAYEPAVAISRAQQPVGTWLDKVLDFEAPNTTRKRGPGLVNQFLALLEYGWELSHPILHCSEELLLQYLDPDARVELFELNAYCVHKPESDRALRTMLSRIAAALLARAGSRDPRLIAFGERFLDQLDRQYKDPANPAVYDGEVEIPEDARYRRLRPDAVPIDMFALYLLAFLPDVRATPRGREITSRAVRHLFASSGLPDLLLEVEGKRLMRLRLPRIFDFGQAQFCEQKLGFLLHDLELLARTNTLLENEKARSLLEWVVSLKQQDGVLRPGPEIEKAITPSQYHYFPLEESWRGKHKKFTDVTFRTLLILTLLDRAEAGEVT
jgi:hypothetical protein